MADITMCYGEGCALKDNCYRHTAPACPYRQSRFIKAPVDPQTKECEYFWDNAGWPKGDKKERPEQPV